MVTHERRGSPCLDCHKSTTRMKENYIVADRIWSEAGLGRTDGCLCVGCLERRIGRALIPDDFPIVGLNLSNILYQGLASERLFDRMGGRATLGTVMYAITDIVDCIVKSEAKEE